MSEGPSNMLTQWCVLPSLTNTVKSSMFMHAHPVHSPWLPGYINVAQTVLVLLTMAGLFLDRPRISETRGVYDSG